MSAPVPPAPPDLPTPDPASAPPGRPIARRVGAVLSTRVVRPLAAGVRAVEFALTWIGDLFVFVLCWIGHTEPTWAEVRRRIYLDATRVPSHALDSAQSEFRFKLQREDSSHTDDKVKQLLTLSAALSTIIVALVRDVRPRWLVVVVLAVLFACVYVCVAALGVRRDVLPGLGDAGQADGSLQAAWARDLAEATVLNGRAHAFRVDLFRAAGRFFRLAFLLTPVLGWYTVPKRDTAAEQSATSARRAAALERQAVALERQAAALERLGRAVDSLAARAAAAQAAANAGAPDRR